MRNTLLKISTLLSSITIAQQYNGVHLERLKIDKNNKVYSIGKEFVFGIHIYDDDSTFYVRNNDSDFELTQNVDSLKISEIHMTVIKPKIFQRTNSRQTEILYSYEPDLRGLGFTGLVENSVNFWAHPPREGYFQALETCPFPYVVLDKPVGYKWTDSMLIDGHWSNDNWGVWSGDLLINYEYEITGTETIDTKLGAINCQVIEAVANTRLGRSALKLYFSEAYGFVKLNYTLLNGRHIDLVLENVIDGPVIRNSTEFRAYKNGQ